MRCFWAVCLAVSAGSGCSSIRVTSDYDTSVDFTGYGSYNWVPDSEKPTGDPRLDNALLDTRVRNAVDGELKAKGYASAPHENCDFFVDYHVLINEKVDVQHINDYYSYRWPSSRTTRTVVSNYEEGTLILDISDAKTRQLTWRGNATTRLTEAGTPEERDKVIREAVQKLLERFPPK